MGWGFQRSAASIAALCAAASAAAPWSGTEAYTLKTIYSFCQPQNCVDGSWPQGGLLMDSAQNLYGTTTAGGASNQGVIFELVASADKKSWSYARLYSFCAKANCSDGAAPQSSLIQDTNGDLYGVATQGGSKGQGMVFELVPNKPHTAWKLLTLYNFCLKASCADGSQATTKLTYAGESSGLAYDGTSPLYGVTGTGGKTNSGIAYVLTRVKNHYHQKVLYNFCAQVDSSCGDSQNPREPYLDASGDLFGVTCCGGPPEQGGSAWELHPAAHGKFKEQTIFAFNGDSPSPTGLRPQSGLMQDASGLLYGVTSNGGSNGGSVYRGVLYSLKLNGKSPATQTVLYDFCSIDQCPDGQTPHSTPVMDSTGRLFGTTFQGGNLNDQGHFGAGVIYSFKGTYSVIYAFCPQSGCVDGSYPSNVIMDPAGNLFGTTQSGGKFGGIGGQGTVFELKR
jgi:uncharacterized repeat protein (TIGR03803 family)